MGAAGGGALQGIGKFLGGLFGGGKCKKKKKQLKQQVGMLKQMVGQLQQQLAHAKGFNQGMMAGLGMRGQPGGFPNAGFPQPAMGGVSVAMSYSMSARMF
jgi:hypothetical protein